MNKAEFVAEVARKASITRAEAARAVDAVFDAESGAISKALQETGEFSITGFGTFTKGSFAHSVPLRAVDLDLHASVRAEVMRPDGNKVVVFKHKRRKVLRSGSAAGTGRRGNAAPITDPDPDPDPGDAAAGIRELARNVWENPADAEEFLTTPHGLLDGETPLAASRTVDGANRVREILLALEYGLPV